MLREPLPEEAGDVLRDLDLAADVLRHRIVLTYDALSEGVSADTLLTKVIAAVPPPQAPPASVGSGRRRAGS